MKYSKRLFGLMVRKWEIIVKERLVGEIVYNGENLTSKYFPEEIRKAFKSMPGNCYLCHRHNNEIYTEVPCRGCPLNIKDKGDCLNTDHMYRRWFDKEDMRGAERILKILKKKYNELWPEKVGQALTPQGEDD